jgi:hypothetical protein
MMSTLIVAAMLIAGTILISLLFVYINKKNEKKRKDQFVKLLNVSGQRHGVSFSSQEFLSTGIIGLDGVKRTLLYIEFANANNVTCIDLAEIKNCTLSKEYSSVLVGTQRNNKTEKTLTSIGILFSLKKGIDPLYVSFYDSGCNSIYEIIELEAKAQNWVSLLSKMTTTEQKAIA